MQTIPSLKRSMKKLYFNLMRLQILIQKRKQESVKNMLTLDRTSNGHPAIFLNSCQGTGRTLTSNDGTIARQDDLNESTN